MTGRRHLTPAEAAAALRRGDQIEQYLGRRRADDGRAAVRWLSAFPSGGRLELVVHDVEDVGSDDFLDVSAFPPLDEEECIGEGRSLAASDDAQGILNVAARHGAHSEHWVNLGLVQDEYREDRPSC